MCEPVSLKEIKAVLIDIEGTTTSLSFVKDVLFPYTRQHIFAYLKENWGEPSLKAIVQDLRKQSRKDVESNLEGAVAIPEEDEGTTETLQKAVVSNILWLMDVDRKTTPLKDLQGKIWLKGYETGDLKSHLYDDVLPCLEKWHTRGIQLYIYSSGSIQAQKLLFGNTNKGSILKILSGYFDTTTGAKTEAESYRKISLALDCKPREVLFLTDVVREADPAKESGMHVILLIRPGNAPLLEQDLQRFPAVHSFEEIK